jgi:hypothetical protein
MRTVKNIADDYNTSPQAIYKRINERDIKPSGFLNIGNSAVNCYDDEAVAEIMTPVTKGRPPKRSK